MKTPPFRIKPFGPAAILLEWPNEIRLDILREILGFSNYLRRAHLPESEWEFQPIYHSLTLVSQSGSIDFDVLSKNLKNWYAQYPGGEALDTKDWELPVCYDAEFGLDLEEAANILGLTPDELIHIHSSHNYPVYGIGFLPGFLYLGGIPKAIQLPRKKHPRPRVVKGAVGLADQQTGIYPQQSPGGWNILGNCPIALFQPRQEPHCFIGLGDTVRFRPVSRAEYDLHLIEAEVGIYDFTKKYGNVNG